MANPTTQGSQPIPEKIGPYRVEASIGKGGMGEVFRGYDARLDRPVALKCVKEQAEVEVPEEARERFQREARALARVRHPSVVEVYDWIEGDHGDWLVMEYLEGRTLRSWVKQGPVALSTGLQIAREMAEGLAAVHAHGIVHRDLKPDNVMLVSPEGLEGETTASVDAAGGATPGRAKLLDFGLAKRVSSMDGLTLTETISKVGQILGTVAYMSPEQAAGLAIDHRSDIFSLGVVLYEMLTGVSPFRGDNALETLTRICTMTEEPLHRRDPSLPVAISELVRRLLRKEPERRLQSASEVAAVLEELAAGVVAGHSDVQLRAALPAEATASGDTTSPTVVGSIATAAQNSALTQSMATAALSGAHVRTLLLNDLVDSTKLVETLGDERAALIFEHHDRAARDLLQRNSGREIDKSDGFLMLFERPIDAVRFALGYHAALAEISEQEGVEVSSRVGIHVGEVMLRVNEADDVARGAKPLEVEGLAKAMAARFMSLAGARQTLISRGVYDLAKRSAVGTADLPARLSWVEHGPYFMKGVEEPVEVFEVGVEGESPLMAPVDTKKVQKAIQPRVSRQRLLIAAATLLVVALIGSFFWWRSIPEPLDVAVLKPTIGSTDDSVNPDLVSAAVRNALVNSLLGLEGVFVTPNDQVDAVEGTSLDALRVLAVDEVVMATVDCASSLCQITLSRAAGGGGDIAWGAGFSSRADELLVLRDAVMQNFRRGYSNRNTKSGIADLEVRAEDYRVYLDLQQSYSERSRPLPEILDGLTALHETSPGFLDAYLLEADLAAVSFYDSRDQVFFKKALAACEAAAGLAPNDLRSHLPLAFLAQDSDQLELWKRAVDQILSLARGHPMALSAESLLLEREGYLELALKKMRQATSLQPSPRWLRLMAMMAYRQGLVPEARTNLKRALELAPDNIRIRGEWAQIELLSGDPPRAVELLEGLVAEAPEVHNLTNLGVAYFLVEDYAKAFEVFQRAAASAPESAAILLNLADSQLLLEQTEEALELYRKIIVLLEKDAFGQTWQGCTIRAQAQAHLGNNEAAVVAVQNALRLAPDNPQVALEAAMVFALIGEITSSLVHLEKALGEGVDTRWLSFPWFDNVRTLPRFQELLNRPSDS